MKYIVFILCLIAGQVLAGCPTPDGGIQPLGSIWTLDEHHPKTIEKQKEFVRTYGLPPQGGMFKFAICTFVVTLETQDYPKSEDRQYVWVATSDIPVSFSENDLNPSYLDE